MEPTVPREARLSTLLATAMAPLEMLARMEAAVPAGMQTPGVRVAQLEQRPPEARTVAAASRGREDPPAPARARVEEVRLAVPVQAEEERPAVLARVAADQREAAASPALAAARDLHRMPVRTRKGSLRRTAGTMTTTKQRLEGFSRSRALRGGNEGSNCRPFCSIDASRLDAHPLVS